MKILTLSLLLLCLITPATAEVLTCTPTAPDQLGPFYKPDAPLRAGVGHGYDLIATVRTAADCRPISGAQVELWMAGPDGEYGDDFRATVFSDGSGRVYFRSHLPPPYFGRPPHIHIRVSAPGFTTLVTQHYPKQGNISAATDLVIKPIAKHDRS